MAPQARVTFITLGMAILTRKTAPTMFFAGFAGQARMVYVGLPPIFCIMARSAVTAKMIRRCRVTIGAVTFVVYECSILPTLCGMAILTVSRRGRGKFFQMLGRNGVTIGASAFFMNKGDFPPTLRRMTILAVNRGLRLMLMAVAFSAFSGYRRVIRLFVAFVALFL